MMKRITQHIIVLICICLSAVVLFACTQYTAVYCLDSCVVSVREHNGENTIDYDRKYETADYTVYIDSRLKDARTIDIWIDRLKSFSAEPIDELQYMDNIYLSDKLICNYWTNDNGETCISFPTKISEEETLAWILEARYGNSVPYGIFAGAAAYRLNKEEYSKFVTASVNGARFLTELQFPIYETGNLPESQRAYAWSFSYSVVSNWLQSGGDEKDLFALDKTRLSSFLSDKFNVALPNYTFYPYSAKYEYKVKQGVFTYFINREFTDLILPESEFTADYAKLSDWLKDNETTTRASDELFEINGNMHDIAVYLDDGLKSNGIAGQAFRDSIDIYSAGSFSHEYIHHVLSQKGKNGFLSEVIPELHANDSKYANLMWYYLLSANANKFPYNQQDREKESYEEAVKLYNKKSAFAAAPNCFDFWLYADCFSALNTEIGTKFVNRLQPDSLQNYIARMYGAEYVWELNMNNNAEIDGRTYSEIAHEWVVYLNDLI